MSPDKDNDNSVESGSSVVECPCGCGNKLSVIESRMVEESHVVVGIYGSDEEIREEDDEKEGFVINEDVLWGLKEEIHAGGESSPNSVESVCSHCGNSHTDLENVEDCFKENGGEPLFTASNIIEFGHSMQADMPPAVLNTFEDSKGFEKGWNSAFEHLTEVFDQP